MKKIYIIKRKCIGCYKCKRVCYSVFEVGSDGKARVRHGISQADIEDAWRAEIACPTGAISIVESDSDSDIDPDHPILDTIIKILDWAIENTGGKE